MLRIPTGGNKIPIEVPGNLIHSQDNIKSGIIIIPPLHLQFQITFQEFQLL